MGHSVERNSVYKGRGSENCEVFWGLGEKAGVEDKGMFISEKTSDSLCDISNTKEKRTSASQDTYAGVYLECSFIQAREVEWLGPPEPIPPAHIAATTLTPKRKPVGWQACSVRGSPKELYAAQRSLASHREESALVLIP